MLTSARQLVPEYYFPKKPEPHYCKLPIKLQFSVLVGTLCLRGAWPPDWWDLHRQNVSFSRQLRKFHPPMLNFRILFKLLATHSTGWEEWSLGAMKARTHRMPILTMSSRKSQGRISIRSRFQWISIHIIQPKYFHVIAFMAIGFEYAEKKLAPRLKNCSIATLSASAMQDVILYSQYE